MLWERHDEMGEYDFYSHCLYYFERYEQLNCNVESLCVLQLFWQIFFVMLLFFSQQVISISTKLWEYKYTKIFNKHKFYNFVKVLNYQCEKFLGDWKNNLKELCKRVNTEQVLPINLKISQQKYL